MNEQEYSTILKLKDDEIASLRAEVSDLHSRIASLALRLARSQVTKNSTLSAKEIVSCQNMSLETGQICKVEFVESKDQRETTGSLGDHWK